MHQRDPAKAGAAILEAVENQLKANDPPKVKEALKRLMSQGVNRDESKKYIASALSVEIFGALKNHEEFNPKRYDQNLEKLPEMPWDEK